MTEVLLIEPRANQELLYEAVLHDAGFGVTTLLPGERLVAAVKRANPGAIILDPCPDGGDPNELIEELRIPSLGIPVLVYSTCDCLRNRCQERDVSWIHKSSDPSNLVLAVRRIVEREHNGTGG